MEIRTDLAPEVWDRFVAAHPQAHILQTSPWGQLKAAFGWQVERVALMREERPVAGAQILYRRLPGGLARLAYVPRGPLVNWEDEGETAALMDALTATARARRAIVLTVEPDLPDFPSLQERLTALGSVSYTHLTLPTKA